MTVDQAWQLLYWLGAVSMAFTILTSDEFPARRLSFVAGVWGSAVVIWLAEHVRIV